MDISVSEFKHRCLEIIRRVEKTGKPVAITRRGKVVVRLNPSGSAVNGGLKPWEQVRSLGGRLVAQPGESVLHDAKAGRRELFLPAISLWEVQRLHAKRRFELPLALCRVARPRGR